MDLIDYRKKHGWGSLSRLSKKMELPGNSYIYQLVSGRKGMSLEMAEKFVRMEPELDAMKLLKMRERAMAAQAA